MYQVGNPYQQYPYYGQAQYGMGVPTMPKAKYTQPLTPEQISKLRSTGDAFKIEVSQDDLLRAACTHKENGQPTLVVEGENPETHNQIVRCTICGETFEMVDASKEEVEKAVDLIYNLMQTSKTMYLDAPVQLVTHFYQMIPLLKMFPKVYERSQKNFSMYENAMGVTPSAVAAGTNGFQMMGAMLSNPYAATGYYPQQPYAGYPQQYPAQPAPAPMVPPAQPYGYPQQTAFNPGYGNPLMYGGAPAPAPAAPAPGMVPPAPVPAPADTSAEVQQAKQFNV